MDTLQGDEEYGSSCDGTNVTACLQDMNDLLGDLDLAHPLQASSLEDEAGPPAHTPPAHGHQDLSSQQLHFSSLATIAERSSETSATSGTSGIAGHSSAQQAYKC